MAENVIEITDDNFEDTVLKFRHTNRCRLLGGMVRSLQNDRPVA